MYTVAYIDKNRTALTCEHYCNCSQGNNYNCPVHALFERTVIAYCIHVENFGHALYRKTAKHFVGNTAEGLWVHL